MHEESNEGNNLIKSTRKVIKRRVLSNMITSFVYKEIDALSYYSLRTTTRRRDKELPINGNVVWGNLSHTPCTASLRTWSSRSSWCSSLFDATNICIRRHTCRWVLFVEEDLFLQIYLLLRKPSINSRLESLRPLHAWPPVHPSLPKTLWTKRGSSFCDPSRYALTLHDFSNDLERDLLLSGKRVSQDGQCDEAGRDCKLSTRRRPEG